MSKKRKDSKGRLLRTGETQRKDGKYEFKYLDSDGTRRTIYSWKLVLTDKLPAGKRDDLSLREKAEQIAKELGQGNNIRKSKMTLSECIESYLEIKTFANSTYENYLYYYKKNIKKSALGRMSISKIKKSNIKRFYSDRSKEGLADGTIQILHKIIHPSLALALEDEIIGKNPADGCCKDYRSAKARDAMSAEEQETFFNEVLKCNRHNEKYYLIFKVMTELACRVNELIGLTWDNIDMQNRKVTIDHGMVYRRKDGEFQFYVTSGTVKNVNRIIPMTNDAYDCFYQLRKERLKNSSKVVIDGYTNFVFTSQSGTPLYPANLNKALNKMVEKYKKESKLEFPSISNHIFRHSGCTNMAEAEIDPNALMHIMGHRNLKMIMGTYDKVNFDRLQKQMSKMNKKAVGK